MSTAFAYARPQQRPETSAPQPRHIAIVPTRAQRRTRPKSVYAVTAVATIFGLLLAQLVLSIVLSDGAFQIADLQAQQRSLSRTQGDLSEKLDVLSSPQNLASAAQGLGMVLGSSTPAFLDLANGATHGSATPTDAGAGSSASAGADLVPNSLLTSQAASGPVSIAHQTTSAPSATAQGASVASGTGALPSPNTH